VRSIDSGISCALAASESRFYPEQAVSFRPSTANLQLGDKIYFRFAMRIPDPKVVSVPLTIFLGAEEVARLSMASKAGSLGGHLTGEFTPEKKGRYRAWRGFLMGPPRSRGSLWADENFEENRGGRRQRLSQAVVRGEWRCLLGPRELPLLVKQWMEEKVRSRTAPGAHFRLGYRLGLLSPRVMSCRFGIYDDAGDYADSTLQNSATDQRGGTHSRKARASRRVFTIEYRVLGGGDHRVLAWMFFFTSARTGALAASGALRCGCLVRCDRSSGVSIASRERLESIGSAAGIPGSEPRLKLMNILQAQIADLRLLLAPPDTAIGRTSGWAVCSGT